MDFPPLGFTDDVLLCRGLKVMRSTQHLYTHSEALVVHRKCSTANNVILQLALWTFVIFKQTNNVAHINSIMVPIFTVNIQPCSNKNRISTTSDLCSYQV